MTTELFIVEHENGEPLKNSFEEYDYRVHTDRASAQDELDSSGYDRDEPLSVVRYVREDLIPKIDENTSDGYHTFKELYDHRIELYIALCRSVAHLRDATLLWKSEKHSDGSVWDGWFLLGINKGKGNQITYHLPMSRWDECAFVETIEQAPPFDGHTSADVLERLKRL